MQEYPRFSISRFDRIVTYTTGVCVLCATLGVLTVYGPSKERDDHRKTVMKALPLEAEHLRKLADNGPALAQQVAKSADLFVDSDMDTQGEEVQADGQQAAGRAELMQEDRGVRSLANVDEPQAKDVPLEANLAKEGNAAKAQASQKDQQKKKDQKTTSPAPEKKEPSKTTSPWAVEEAPDQVQERGASDKTPEAPALDLGDEAAPLAVGAANPEAEAPVEPPVAEAPAPEPEPAPQPEPVVEEPAVVEEPVAAPAAPAVAGLGTSLNLCEPDGTAASVEHNLNALIQAGLFTPTAGHLNYSSFADNGDGASITVNGTSIPYLSVENRYTTCYDGLACSIAAGDPVPKVNATASGVIAQRGLCAANGFVIGSVLFVENYGFCVVADRTGGQIPGLVDVCYNGGEAMNGIGFISNPAGTVYCIN